jgi:hypothetical protein
MRSNRWAYIAVVVGLIVGMLALLNRQNTVQAQANKLAVVWEYKTLYWGGGDPNDSLNELGKGGWELVTSRGYGDEPQSQTLFVFKRVKP